MSIPKGYQLQITSWTNDGDHYNITIHSGLSAEDVQFLIDIVKPFKSCNGGGDFGNNDNCTDEVDKHIYECYLNHRDSSNSKYADWFEDRTDADLDGLSDLAYDLVGCDEHCGWRIFESAKVFFYPEDLQEVTKQFI